MAAGEGLPETLPWQFEVRTNNVVNGRQRAAYSSLLTRTSQIQHWVRGVVLGP